MTYDDAEGPITDPKAEKERAKAEREKPEHAYQRGPNGEPDPRDQRIGEADINPDADDGTPEEDPE